MKLLLIITLIFTHSLYAEVLKRNEAGDFILVQKKFKVREILEDYGRLMSLNLTIAPNMDDEIFEIQGEPIVPKEQIESYVSTIVTFGGNAMIKKPNSNFVQIIDARDIRYSSVPVFSKVDDIPADNNQYQLSYTLNHVNSSELARNLRPFLSRYGRVIDMKDNSLHIADLGKNIIRVAKIIEVLDTPEYKKSKEEIAKINENHKKALVKEKTFLEILNQNQVIFIFIFFLMGSVIGFGTRGYMMKKVEGGW